METANRVRKTTQEVLDTASLSQRPYMYNGVQIEATPRSSSGGSYTARSRATTASFSPSPTQSRTSKGTTKPPIVWRSDTHSQLYHENERAIDAEQLHKLDGSRLCGSYPVVRDVLQEVIHSHTVTCHLHKC